jgi:hypothetical protein
MAGGSGIASQAKNGLLRMVRPNDGNSDGYNPPDNAEVPYLPSHLHAANRDRLVGSGYERLQLVSGRTNIGWVHIRTRWWQDFLKDLQLKPEATQPNARI